MKEKVCTICKELKPINEFRPNKSWFASECRLCHNANNRKYATLNKKKEALRHKIYKENNRDKWRIAHAKSQRIRNAKRYPKDLIATTIRSKVWRQLTTGKYGKRTFELLGYSVEDLMGHLEKQFKEGMSWNNFGDWHIDHIIPKSVFNVSNYDDLDFKRCWALNNLQPLWATENYIKRDKLTKPFQPSLNIGVAG